MVRKQIKVLAALICFSSLSFLAWVAPAKAYQVKPLLAIYKFYGRISFGINKTEFDIDQYRDLLIFFAELLKKNDKA